MKPSGKQQNSGLIGNRQKAIIHIAKAELKLSDDNYRALLNSVGVESSKDLTWWQYNDLLSRLKALGFRIKSGKSRAKWQKSPPREKEKLLKKIEAQLADLGLPSAYADGVARKVAKVDRVVFADAAGLIKVIAALTYHQQRQK